MVLTRNHSKDTKVNPLITWLIDNYRRIWLVNVLVVWVCLLKIESLPCWSKKCILVYLGAWLPAHSASLHASLGTLLNSRFRGCGRLIASISKPVSDPRLSPASACPTPTVEYLQSKSKIFAATPTHCGARINKSKCQLKRSDFPGRQRTQLWLICCPLPPGQPALRILSVCASVCLACPAPATRLARLAPPLLLLLLLPSLSGVLIFHPHRALWLMLHLWPLNVKRGWWIRLALFLFLFLLQPATLIAPSQIVAPLP